MEYIDRKSFQIKIVAAKATKTDSRFTQELLSEMETYYRHYRPKPTFEGHKAERLTTSVAFKTPCARP
jgi:hypothetical protein